jgi:hypothetical protein
MNRTVERGASWRWLYIRNFASQAAASERPSRRLAIRQKAAIGRSFLFRGGEKRRPPPLPLLNPLIADLLVLALHRRPGDAEGGFLLTHYGVAL